MGLNESYINVRSNVFMRRPVMSVNEAYAIVTQEESQRTLGVINTNRDPLTILAGKPQGFKPRKPGLICEYCGYNCKIVGYPIDFKSKKKPQFSGHRTYANTASADDAVGSTNEPQGYYLIEEQYKQLVGLLRKPTEGECFTNMTGIISLLFSVAITSWVVDSGATHHITYNKEILNNVKTSGKQGCNSVKFPTGNKARITQTGDGLYSGKVLGIGKESKGLYILREYAKAVGITVCAKTALFVLLLNNEDYSFLLAILRPLSKCEVYVVLKNFISVIRTQFKVNIKILRSDNENTQFTEPSSTPTFGEQNTPASPVIAPEPHPNSPEPYPNSPEPRAPSTTDTNIISIEEDSTPDNAEIPDLLLTQQLDTTNSAPPQPSSPSAVVALRLQKNAGSPIWLKDYITAGNLPGKSKYTISNHVTYDHLSPPYQSYLKAFSVIIEPKTYKEAATD
ncbi:uncharacterized protein [Nicotiana sylvestris]|uniref:uncharacterized protein n=1 Tax=Nicotiana sylvestris TaxID=4096 RepID=UPI00388CB78C